MQAHTHDGSQDASSPLLIESLRDPQFSAGEEHGLKHVVPLGHWLLLPAHYFAG